MMHIWMCLWKHVEKIKVFFHAAFYTKWNYENAQGSFDLSKSNSSRDLNTRILHCLSIQPHKFNALHTQVKVDLVPDEVIGFFNWPNPSSHIMALASSQPLTEMSTKNPPGDKGWLARKADNLTVCLENVGALTSQNPMGLHSLLQG
jgi:hypothetical protein